MIKVINKDNSEWKLIYDADILLLDKSKRLSFDIDDKDSNFKIIINFHFLDDGEKMKTKVDVSDDGSVLDITLYQWDSSAPNNNVENVEPLKLHSLSGKKIWCKFRTQTSEKNNWRNFHLTTWLEQ